MPSSTGRSPYHGASSRYRGSRERNSLSNSHPHLGFDTSMSTGGGTGTGASNANSNANVNASHNLNANATVNQNPSGNSASSSSIFSPNFDDMDANASANANANYSQMTPNFSSRLSFSPNANTATGWNHNHNGNGNGNNASHSHAEWNASSEFISPTPTGTGASHSIIHRGRKTGGASTIAGTTKPRILTRKKSTSGRHSTSRLGNSSGSILANGIPRADDSGVEVEVQVHDAHDADVHARVHGHVEDIKKHALERETNTESNAERDNGNKNTNRRAKAQDPNDKLRNLIHNSLHSTITTPSPSAAVFYSSILYTKTESPQDAYLFATALAANNEKRRAAFILEKAGLLSFESLNVNMVYDGGAEDIANGLDSEIRYVRLVVEAMLLAAECFASFGEWDDATALLEDAGRYELEEVTDLNEIRESKFLSKIAGGHGPVSVTATEGPEELTEVEISLLRLAHFLNGTLEEEKIHPVARLCLLRGKACDEASNPSRAASFLKLALDIDIKCIEAWTYLCQRRLLTSEEEIRLVESLRFDEPGMEWLRDFFFARLSIGGVVSSTGAGDGVVVGKSFSNIASPINPLSPMNNIMPEQPTPQMSINADASSIQYQGTPTTPFNFNSRHDAANHQTPKPERNENAVKKEVEMAFQNLHFKHQLSKSPDVLALAATRAYNAYNLSLALHYCQVLYEMDPLSTDAASIQIATLTAMGHKRPLFRLAHALVDANSKSATAWFAVGCYYYACGRFDLAQQHYWRATRLDPRSANCWVAFGCAFAACDENDQANACFRTAQRLHSGSHYPMLYMGMEHLRTNNIPLAGHFLKSARSMEKYDPLCCNELGVWAYRSKEWTEAIRWFILALRLYVEADISEKYTLSWSDENALKENLSVNKPRFEFGQEQGREVTTSFSDRDCIEFCHDAFWEATIFNLGQSYRKARRFADASHCFQKCLALCPEKATTFSALGFTRHLAGDLDGAIDSYHQALSRKPDDPFASDMLNRAMHESLELGPMMIPAGGDISASMSMNMGLQQSLSQSSIGDSALSLGDSDVDMDM